MQLKASTCSKSIWLGYNLYPGIHSKHPKGVFATHVLQFQGHGSQKSLGTFGERASIKLIELKKLPSAHESTDIQ